MYIRYPLFKHANNQRLDMATFWDRSYYIKQIHLIFAPNETHIRRIDSNLDYLHLCHSLLPMVTVILSVSQICYTNDNNL